MKKELSLIATDVSVKQVLYGAQPAVSDVVKPLLILKL
jgi:hypothetical protein